MAKCNSVVDNMQVVDSKSKKPRHDKKLEYINHLQIIY